MKRYDTPIDEIQECPHCGSGFGYYSKAYVCGWVHDNTLFTGEKHNCAMYDHLTFGRESKFYFCMECDKQIARVEKQPV